MRLVFSASRWGNLYKNRYYMNGKRIDAKQFAGIMYNIVDNNFSRVVENTVFGYRVVIVV